MDHKLESTIVGDHHYSRLQDIQLFKALNYVEDNNQIHPNFKPRVEAVIHAISELISGYQCTSRGRKDHSVYTGYTGLALTHFLIYKRTKDPQHLEIMVFRHEESIGTTFRALRLVFAAAATVEAAEHATLEQFQIAQNLTDGALTRLTGHEVSFLTGDAGPLTLGTIIYHIQGDHPRSSELRLRLLLLALNPDPHIPCALINGWAGYLYALLFLNKHIPDSIPMFEIKRVVQKILKIGVLNNSSRAPLNFEWQGENYLGALYGVSGILYMLLSSGVLEETEIFILVRPTLDELISSRKMSVNYPPYPECRHDLVQWCHGSPGFVALFLKASEVINPSYLANAVECSSIIWRYGVLRKGYTLCHGVCGNAYAFLQLFRTTKDRKYLLRAVSFYEWCLHWPRYEAVKPDRPFSLFKGHAGLLYFLTDMKDTNTAAFPGFEL